MRKGGQSGTVNIQGQLMGTSGSCAVKDAWIGFPGVGMFSTQSSVGKCNNQRSVIS